MLSKTGTILIIGMIILLAVATVSAYDYRGVPKPGDNNPEAVAEDTIPEVEDISSEGLDIASILGSSEITSLITLILSFLMKLFGISSS